MLFSILFRVTFGYNLLQVARYLKKEHYPNGPGDKSHTQIIKDIFNEEDKNNDGRISHEEFSGTKRYPEEL